MENELPHKLTLTQCRNLVMSGVSEVVSFEETSVVVQTSQGTLLIRGEGLSLRSLVPEGGRLTVDGTVTALSYEPVRTGWLGRLFG